MRPCAFQNGKVKKSLSAKARLTGYSAMPVLECVEIDDGGEKWEKIFGVATARTSSTIV